MTALPATLTMREAPEALRQLGLALGQEAGGQWVIDASPLKAFDTSALAVLLECRRLAQAAGKTCTVSHASGKLQSMAQMYGVDELLPAA